MEDYNIIEDDGDSRASKATKKEAIQDDEQEYSHISLTDGKSSAAGNSSKVPVEIIEEKAQAEEPKEPPSSKPKDQKKERKYRESCRNREERMKRQGQECERCKQVSTVLGNSL